MLTVILPFLAIFLGSANADSAETDAPAIRTLAIGERVESLAIEQWVRLKDKPIGALQRGSVYVIDFWATWCGPCRVIAPTIEKLAADIDGKAKEAKLDVDNNPQTAQAVGIRSIPTLLFFKGGQVVDQKVGVVPEKILAQTLESLAAQPA